MDRPHQRFPGDEPIQPDPQLQLSQGGRATGIQITMVAIACMLIVALLIYGLNQPVSEGPLTASAPQGQETTGTAPPQTPQTGGNVAGGENAAPTDQAAPQQQPAQEPTPQQQKPGVVEDDSTR